jgi:hypothetical protein
MTQEEALRSAFGAAATVERRTAFLDPARLERVRALAGSEAPVESSVVTYYVAFAAGRAIGVAYFDAHRVRTREEVLMITVTPEDRIGRIEVLRWAEPPEYRAPDGWMRQFPGRELSDGLSVRGEIAGITGASLTARAVTAASRRVLALHAVIAPLSGAF